MGRCEYCGSAVLFGGVREGTLRFCNARCRARGAALLAARQIPEAVVAQHVRSVHAGLCPQCGGRGPVDVHTGYRVWSAIALTSWVNTPRVVCRSCGVRGQLGDALFSLLLGWWGFPWGLVMTPVQIVRDVAGALRGPDPAVPSQQLEKLVRLNLGAQALAGVQAKRAA